MTRVYKILPRSAWEAAKAAGAYVGSAVDRADGFIHFSTGAQLAETAARHFRGQADLVVLALEAEPLGAALRWEPSRGGALFPHLYGALEPAWVLEVSDAPLGADGAPQTGERA